MDLHKLQDLIAIQSGYATRGKAETDPHGDFALLKISDIDDEGRFDPNKLDRYADVTPGPQHVLHAGDVLFATRGSHNWAVHVAEDMPDIAATSHLYILRVEATDRLDAAFLAWYLNQQPAQAYFEALSTGTHIPRVNQQVLGDLTVPLPPLAAQKQIARAGSLAVEEFRLALHHAERRRELIESLLLKTLTDKADQRR